VSERCASQGKKPNGTMEGHSPGPCLFLDQDEKSQWKKFSTGKGKKKDWLEGGKRRPTGGTGERSRCAETCRKGLKGTRGGKSHARDFLQTK